MVREERVMMEGHGLLALFGLAGNMIDVLQLSRPCSSSPLGFVFKLSFGCFQQRQMSILHSVYSPRTSFSPSNINRVIFGGEYWCLLLL